MSSIKVSVTYHSEQGTSKETHLVEPSSVSLRLAFSCSSSGMNREAHRARSPPHLGLAVRLPAVPWRRRIEKVGEMLTASG
jgi:hypothetical protein